MGVGLLTYHGSARAVTGYRVRVVWILDEIWEVCDRADDEHALRDQNMQYSIGHHQWNAISVWHRYEIARALYASGMRHPKCFSVTCKTTPFVANKHAC